MNKAFLQFHCSINPAWMPSHTCLLWAYSSHSGVTGRDLQAPSPLLPASPGGFGFLEEPPLDDAAETPTLRSAGMPPAAGAGSAAAAAASPPFVTSPSGRRRVVVFEDGFEAGGGSRASGSGGEGWHAGGGCYPMRRVSGQDASDVPSPASDAQGVGGLGGLHYAASSRSLSQGALNEMAYRCAWRWAAAPLRA
jgi:hypothetical protein